MIMKISNFHSNCPRIGTKTRMDTFWIIFFTTLALLLLSQETSGQSDVEVQLRVKKYVEKGSHVTIYCDHNVKPEILYKVTWLKNGYNKFFEFINGRNPPYRNFTIPGAEVDMHKSDAQHVTIKNLDFDATGLYYCEVSTDTPIFTKASNERQMNVILPQTGPPNIIFRKRQFFIGDRLIANCTTSKAKPPPHITWLINGEKVDEKFVRTLHPYATNGRNSHRGKTAQQSQQQLQQQQQQQQQPQLNNHPSTYDKNEMRDPYAAKTAFVGTKAEEFGDSTNDRNAMNADNNFQVDRYNHYNNNNNDNNQRHYPHNNYREPTDFYDNKYYENQKKHRTARFHKHRRYVNDGTGKQRNHRPMMSASQLSIELSEQHIDANRRLEITCLATIPSHVNEGEQYADYKTYSVKIDVEAAEPTSPSPPESGPAALGNSSNGSLSLNQQMLSCNKSILLLLLCLATNFLIQTRQFSKK